MRTDEQRERDGLYFSELSFGGQERAMGDTNTPLPQGKREPVETGVATNDTVEQLQREVARLRAALAAIVDHAPDPKTGKGTKESWYLRGKWEQAEIAREALDVGGEAG